MSAAANPKKSHAEQMLAALRQGFIADLPKKFDDIDQLILPMKSDDDFVERFDELFRQVHSLKAALVPMGSTYTQQFVISLKNNYV